MSPIRLGEVTRRPPRTSGNFLPVAVPGPAAALPQAFPLPYCRTVDKTTPLAFALCLAWVSGAVVVPRLRGAWATFDFWEPIPLFPCVVAAGLLAALAVYVRTRSAPVSLVIGGAVGGGTLLAALIITLAGWEG